MKYFLIISFGIIFANPCIAITTNSDNELIALRNEIKKLETQLASKTETLNKCAKKNKNFQIAGITTVGLTGIGIATNISLSSKQKDQKLLIENMKNKITTADTESEKFMKELEELQKNLDTDKFAQEIKIALTESEFTRLQELYNNDLDNASESDKVLFEKIIRTMRKCQK